MTVFYHNRSIFHRNSNSNNSHSFNTSGIRASGNELCGQPGHVAAHCTVPMSAFHDTFPTNQLANCISFFENNASSFEGGLPFHLHSRPRIDRAAWPVRTSGREKHLCRKLGHSCEYYAPQGEVSTFHVNSSYLHSECFAKSGTPHKDAWIVNSGASYHESSNMYGIGPPPSGRRH